MGRSFDSVGRLEYVCRMRQKTSVTLPREALAGVDEIAAEAASNRSRVIEQAVVEFLDRRRRLRRDARDREILDSAADELNLEVEDVLRYQTLP